ncbi:universal stress protein A-like protein [Coffea arabica]|nr:universal stress protein A-like protein [Coffea arabica]
MEEGRNPSTGEKKKVMVAIDESDCSIYALEWTLSSLHESIANSELLIFTAQPIADYSYLHASSMGATTPELVKSFQEQQKRAADALLEKAKDVCAKHGVTAQTATEVGDPKDAICEAVEKFKVSMLVLGSHGRGAIKRAFLGSVSNYCIHNAKTPVLVVRKKD